MNKTIESQKVLSIEQTMDSTISYGYASKTYNPKPLLFSPQLQISKSSGIRVSRNTDKTISSSNAVISKNQLRGTIVSPKAGLNSRLPQNRYDSDES